MTHRRTAFAIIVLSLAATPASAQIPVTDTASITSRAAEHIAVLQKWKEQYDKLVEMQNIIHDTHEALTGIRNIGDIFDDPTLRQYLPADWRQLYRAIQRGDADRALSEAQEILNDGQRIDPCDIESLPLPPDVKAHCEAERIKPAQDLAIAHAATESVERRSEQIQQLQSEINATEDPKAIAELQARIAIEQAMIDNEATRLALAAEIARAEDRMLEIRQKELQARTFGATGGVEIEPLTFGD